MPVAVCFLAHQFTPSLAHRFERLRRETGDYADCFVLLDDGDQSVVEGWRGFLASIGASQAFAPFRMQELPGQLGLRDFGTMDIMGSAHFPLMQFARTSGHTQWWQIEYDVDLRGNWRTYFEACAASDAHLLASHFHNYADWPSWSLWHRVMPPPGVAVRRNQLVKAFFPISRFSHEAFRAIHEAYLEGWRGHFEPIIPTVLSLRGLAMQDLAQLNRSYVGGSQNPCAILPLQSTMRWRPEITPQEFLQRDQGVLLFHPVKQNWSYDGERIVSWPETPVGKKS